MQIHSRLPDIGTTIFTIMSKMASEHNAINLSQGFPDFDIDNTIIHLVNKYMLEGNNQYAPMPGTLPLREAIANVIFKTYANTVDPDTQVTITAGATQAIFSIIAAFISPGDEVILFDPAYDSYNPAIRLNGGVPVNINLHYPEFSIDWEVVKRKITKRTKMIMINTPHNPCSSILSSDDLLQLEAIALEHGLLVLSDEVYERLVFDGKRHESVLRYPGLRNQSLAVYSFGKTFHATGWKVGYVVAPAYLMTEVRKAHQFITFSVNTPVQLALAEYLQDEGHYLKLAEFYQRKRDFFLENLRGSSFRPLPSYGSYFQLLSFKDFSNKGDTAVAEELTKVHKVAAIPISVFYQDKTDYGLLRFCFAKKEETLLRATDILKRL